MIYVHHLLAKSFIFIEVFRILRKVIKGRFIVLPVGDRFHPGSGKDCIVYRYMPAEEVYSIVQMKREFFYRGYSWNLFYPEGRNKITIDGVSILVENVTPKEIRLHI